MTNKSKMNAALANLRKWVKTPLGAACARLLGLYYAGAGRDCPVCEKSSRKFLRFGEIPREDALCPQCGALERHRLLWRFFLERTDLFDGRAKKVLHVAPERCFLPRLRRRLGEGYLTADMSDPGAMAKIDITAIPFPDASFDVILCSHVLEHVDDDRQAMREFRRTLKPDGWAVLLVPINAEKTIEDPSITDPAERLRRFGQEDHVRVYGPDYVDRLREAGFEVEVTRIGDLASPDDARRMGLTAAAGEIYRCRPAGGAGE